MHNAHIHEYVIMTPFGARVANSLIDATDLHTYVHINAPNAHIHTYIMTPSGAKVAISLMDDIYLDIDFHIEHLMHNTHMNAYIMYNDCIVANSVTFARKWQLF